MSWFSSFFLVLLRRRVLVAHARSRDPGTPTRFVVGVAAAAVVDGGVCVGGGVGADVGVGVVAVVVVVVVVVVVAVVAVVVAVVVVLVLLVMS